MCGLTFDDFCLLTPFEFGEVVEAVQEREAHRQREAWEQLRVLGTLAVSPWAKGSLKPSEVLPLPWDKEERLTGVQGQAVEDKETEQRRFEALMARRGMMG